VGIRKVNTLDYLSFRGVRENVLLIEKLEMSVYVLNTAPSTAGRKGRNERVTRNPHRLLSRDSGLRGGGVEVGERGV
jgi:hypothetical protein